MINNEWSQEMTPQAPKPPPPMHVKQSSAFWEEDVSLPSLSDNLSPGTNSQQSDAFSSDPSLGMRVQNSLKRYVPQSKSTPLKHQNHHPYPGKKALVANLGSERGSTTNESKNDTALDSFLKNQIDMAHQTDQARNDRTKRNVKAARRTPQSDDHPYGEELTRLYKTIEILSSSNNKLIQEKRDTHVKLTEVMAKCTAAESSRHESDGNFTRSQDELKESRLKTNELISKTSMQEEELKTLSSKYHGVNGKYEDLRTMRERSSSQESDDIQRLRKCNEELNIEVRSLLTENRRLRRQTEESISSLDLKEKECQKLTEERVSLLDRLVKPVQRNAAVQTTTAKTASIEVQTDVLPHTSDYWMDSSMSERLTRIREVSERTCLLREHQKEMDRVTQDYEKALRQMEVRNLQQIHELEEQAVEEHGAKLQQCKRTQTTEYQKRLVEMEERHRVEISKIRHECNHALAVTEDSLEVALTQVKAITEQHDHECRIRQSVEVKLEKSYSDYEQQTMSLTNKHTKEIASLIAKSEEERTVLLDDLQRDCMELLKSRRRIVSPLSVAISNSDHQEEQNHFHFNMRDDTDETHQHRISPNSQSAASATTVSQSLAETEAYVLRVLGGNCL